MLIRPAVPAEAGLISDLALRSKAYWGYSPAFLEACRVEMTLTEVYIAAHPIFVLENGGRLLGFYSLRDRGTAAELDYLFVEPDAIGQGIGKRLWGHSVQHAHQLGYQELYIVSDPHAEAFYLSMGAERTGEVLSPVQAGRLLPVLRYRLAESENIAG